MTDQFDWVVTSISYGGVRLDWAFYGSHEEVQSLANAGGFDYHLERDDE